jgi:hypothetical protein
MAATKRTLFPPILNTVSLPTWSADGNIALNSARFEKSDTPAKGGGLVNVTASKAVGLNQVDL